MARPGERDVEKVYFFYGFVGDSGGQAVEAATEVVQELNVIHLLTLDAVNCGEDQLGLRHGTNVISVVQKDPLESLQQTVHSLPVFFNCFHLDQEVHVARVFRVDTQFFE